MAKPILSEVTWDDAWVDGDSPVDPLEVRISHKPQVIKTIGYILLQDEVGISIANEHYDTEGVTFYRGRTFIPAGMVKKVSRIRKSTVKPNARPASIVDGGA